MSSLPVAQPAVAFRFISRSIAVIVSVAGTLVLAGWVASDETLTSISPGWVSMKANAAFCFVLCGVSLWLRLSRLRRNPLERISQGLAVAVFLVGVFTVLEYAMGLDFGIDQALFRDTDAAATAIPGRMAAMAAGQLRPAGMVSVLLQEPLRPNHADPRAARDLRRGSRRCRLCLRGARSSSRSGPRFIAPHAAVAFVLFSVGMILGQPAVGFMRLASRKQIGGLLMRRLLPAMLVVPFVIGWFILAGEHLGWYRHDTAWALFALATAIALAGTAGRSASILNGLDESLRRSTATLRAEHALKVSNERYRALFENMLDGYAYCRMLFYNEQPRDFIYIEVNGAFEKLMGLRNVEGKRITEVFPEIREINPSMFEIYGRVSRTGVPERFEQYLSSLKTWVIVSVYSPQQDYFIAIFENITERKNLEHTIEEQKNLLLTVIDSLPDLIFAKDTRGRFILANKALAIASGTGDPRSLVGKTDYDISSEGDRGRLCCQRSESHSNPGKARSTPRSCRHSAASHRDGS